MAARIRGFACISQGESCKREVPVADQGGMEASCGPRPLTCEMTSDMDRSW